VTHPTLELNVAAAGINSIVWATGYALDFGWIMINNAFDEHRRPKHHRGVSTVQGLYFLGLSWLSRRASAFIWGVWHDAGYLANYINSLNARRAANAASAL
jgi:putative flavoprotein involved in K+ transport